MFKLKIETGNAAFEGENKIPEIKRILHAAIDKLEDGNIEAQLMDSNGNSAGSYTLTKG